MRAATLVFAWMALAVPVRGDDEAPPAEKPAAEKTAKPGEITIADPGTAIEDSAVARQQIARFEKEMREADGPEKKVEAIERLAAWDHPALVKPLAKHLKDKDYKVAVAAAVGVARQSKAAAEAGKELLGAVQRDKRTAVVCAAFVGMGRLGYENKAAVKEAERFFRVDTTETHKAATRYLGYVKHKPAFRMLAERLEEPHPARPDDPKNPPASWWKERWYEWESNVPYTRWAISQLVPGETFDKLEEAKRWAESEGAKHGIKW